MRGEKVRSRFTFVASVVILALAGNACRPSADPLPGFPRLVLWAWERPENLSYIQPSTTGIAYLAETIDLHSAALNYRPRLQPLRVPPQTPLIAVVRLESRAPVLTAAARPPTTLVSDEIARVAARAPIRALQIDYDARASERDYYRQLMTTLRQTIPPRIALEMTALVSWCEDDDWIHNMPVVDAVPMFFRMGVDPHSTREHLREPLCQSSLGISTDEFYVIIPAGKRVFVFSHRPWTESTYRAVSDASKKWFTNW